MRHVLPAILLIALFYCLPAKADTINHVDALGVFSNDFQNAPTETFNGSFDWDVTTQALVPNSMSYTTTGPLGPFALAVVDEGFAAWLDPFRDNIQINFGDHSIPATFNTVGTFLPYSVELICGTFQFNNQACLGGTDIFYESRTGGVTITDPPDTTSAVPEPPAWTMLMAGLAGLCLFRTRKLFSVGIPNQKLLFKYSGVE